MLINGKNFAIIDKLLEDKCMTLTQHKELLQN